MSSFLKSSCGTLSPDGPRPGVTIPWPMALVRG
ncbi:hypothetical protein LOK49_LG06G00537 [Camellia lanceoleosa]|uniref:Uncharacterized protein n=2 Tax=Camellia lanceoleosa TaxID=1840588 RepID=A0ACC0HIG6_9ERIC|nr:hypothetical protein LOK49_LG06G00703 [Camellia lanceoleosa]KAI8012240.1 hypothetical protein LOK49_LG06G00537 [Camellia lanceoleosa]